MDQLEEACIVSIRPLGPEGIRARIAQIESRLRELDSASREEFTQVGANVSVPIGGFGAGMNTLHPMDRGFGQALPQLQGPQTLEPMQIGAVSPSNANVSRTQLEALADSTAAEFGIDQNLFRALIKWESSWNPNTISSAGAQGLTQLMPQTARYLGVADPFDPKQNLRGGAKYLKEQLDRFGSVELALAAYNAGPGAVKKHGGVPPYQETQTYLRRILGELRR